MTDAVLGRGVISRGPFIVRVILYNLALFALGIALGVGAAVANRLGIGSSDPAAAPLGMAALIGFFVAGAIFIVAMIRLVAARARDIGWSPWPVVIAYVIMIQLPLLVLAVVPGRDSAR